MVWASPTPLQEEAIAQARINHCQGSAQLLVRAESSREDRGQGGESEMIGEPNTHDRGFDPY